MLICNVAPTDGNFKETLSSLRFATRVKTVKNEANVVHRSALEVGAVDALRLQQRNADLEDEVSRLRRKVRLLENALDMERSARRTNKLAI